MLLGEWWVANPTVGLEAYKPPDPAERVPGVLREVARGRFVLETIGFLGDRPFMAGGPPIVMAISESIQGRSPKVLTLGVVF